MTPSLQTSGAPHFFWISTDLDFDPSVTPDRVGKLRPVPSNSFSRATDRNSTCL
jgi:hypothetical protein